MRKHIKHSGLNDLDALCVLWQARCEFLQALTPEAMIRTSIRKERRERRETVDSWAKIIGTIITICNGLDGAIIGLVAVWKK